MDLTQSLVKLQWLSSQDKKKQSYNPHANTNNHSISQQK